MLVVSAALGISCDVSAPDADDETRGFNRPNLRVLGVSVTTSYDADGRPVRSPLTQGGETAVTDVPLSASIAVRFDRLLLPHRIVRQSLCIRPSTDAVESIEQCADPVQPFAQVEYNPVLRTVFFRLDDVQLDADTRYRVSLFATGPADEGEQGFFAFDGAPLGQKYIFDFQTAPDASTAQPERLPTSEAYCAAVNCFEACAVNDSACRAACRPLCVEPSCFQNGDLLDGTLAPTLLTSCAFGQCHAAGSPTSPEPNPAIIAMGLDLFTREGIAATAINVTAHQTQTGESAYLGDQSPARFGRAMPIVAPFNPGNSYLMYKIIANPLNHRRTAAGALADPTSGNAEPDFAFEIDRLRDSVVVGLPMPATQNEPASIYDLDMVEPDPQGELALERLLLLNTWIAHGAVLDCGAN